MTPLWRAVLLSRFQCPPILLSPQLPHFFPWLPQHVPVVLPRKWFIVIPSRLNVNPNWPDDPLPPTNEFSYAPYANEDWIHGTRHLLMATLVGDDKNFPSYVCTGIRISGSGHSFSGWFNDWMTILWAPHITLFLENLWICACTRFPWQLCLITTRCRPREMLIKSGRN